MPIKRDDDLFGDLNREAGEMFERLANKAREHEETDAAAKTSAAIVFLMVGTMAYQELLDEGIDVTKESLLEDVGEIWDEAAKAWRECAS